MYLMKEIRDRFKMTQAAFAEAIGVNQSTVSRWERGITSPSLLEIAAISRLAKERKVRLKGDWFLEAAQ